MDGEHVTVLGVEGRLHAEEVERHREERGQLARPARTTRRGARVKPSETGAVEASGVLSSLNIEPARRTITPANQAGFSRMTASARRVRRRSRSMPSGVKSEAAYSGRPASSASIRVSSTSVSGSPNLRSGS